MIIYWLMVLIPIFFTLNNYKGSLNYLIWVSVFISMTFIIGLRHETGGDWANYRIIPDCVRSWSKSKRAKLRNPNATRPWQHVLEAVGGYLCLAINLKFNKNLHGESFNFGPNLNKEYSVLELVKTMSGYWDDVSWKIVPVSKKKFFESELLRLNCNKAKKILKWKSILKFEETIEMVTNWYSSYYSSSRNIDYITKNNLRNLTCKINYSIEHIIKIYN